MPEITGDTANGRSISVISRFRPGKTNLEMHQAAATPNTRLIGTAIEAIRSVSRAALNASGSEIARQ